MSATPLPLSLAGQLEVARLLLAAYPSPDLTPADLLTLPGWPEYVRWVARNLHSRAGRLPDGVCDTTRKRIRKARAILQQVDRMYAPLIAHRLSGELIFLSVSLPGLTLPEFYGRAGHKAARRVALKLSRGLPALWFREWGEGEACPAHVHLILPAELWVEIMGHARGGNIEVVTAPQGLAEYLAKLLDARTNRSEYRPSPPLPGLLAAYADLCAARALDRAAGGQRLPRKWGTVNLSRPAATKAARPVAAHRAQREHATARHARIQAYAASILARLAAHRPRPHPGSLRPHVAPAPAVRLSPSPACFPARRGDGPAP